MFVPLQRKRALFSLYKVKKKRKKMEKKTTKKAVAAVDAAAVETKAPARKCCRAKKASACALSSAETIGSRAGDVYQALASAGQPLTVAELVKSTKATEQDVLLAMGWLFREGKLTVDGEAVALC